MRIKRIKGTASKRELRKLLNAVERGEVSKRQVDAQAFNRPSWNGKYFTGLLESKGLV